MYSPMPHELASSAKLDDIPYSKAVLELIKVLLSSPLLIIFTSFETSPLELKGAVALEEKDLRVDTYRASGAGGQHVNTTDSAIRITHIPTNIVVQCQSDRSQHRNRATALNMLKARIYELELQKREQAAMDDNATKSDIGWGSQIRSYVLDQSRIKDLRTGHETGNVQAVLDGFLDPFIEESLKKGL